MEKDEQQPRMDITHKLLRGAKRGSPLTVQVWKGRGKGLFKMGNVPVKGD